MARPISQRIYWPGTLAEARTGLQPCIADFIAAANRGQHLVESEQLAASDRLDGIAHRALLAMSEGRPFKFWGWPEWMAVAWLNIDAHMRASDPPSLRRRLGISRPRRSTRPGKYHLRRCRVCRAWMFVPAANRVICRECRHTEQKRRQAKSREKNEGTIARARAGV
jgi:hypothetical protein